MEFINLHTHQAGGNKSIQIKNIFAQDLPLTEPDFLFSAGIHPWHIEKIDIEKSLQNLEDAIRLKRMVAVGECGLDRLVKIDFAIQKQIFKIQATLAEKYHNPLIIHCVKSYQDLIQIKKETKNSIPWIIHGFNGKMEVCKDLIRHGFFFSIGESLLNEEKKHPILRAIPSDFLFLETDDRDISIQKIYLLAAQILETDEEALAERIALNFKNLFGDGILVTTN